jgi:hypothetical protein
VALMSIAVSYAIVRIWWEPGMSSVEDAGMITPVQMTAVVESFVTPTAPAVAVDTTPLATAESGDITATLDSVYADAQSIAVTFTLYNVPDAIRNPQMPDSYDIMLGLTYPDGSIFNATMGWSSLPGPVPGSMTLQGSFEPVAPLQENESLDLIFQISIQHMLT